MAKFALILTFDDFAARDAARPEHRVYLRSLLDAGKLHEAGPFMDDRGALIIYEVADQDEAAALLKQDPYTRAGNVIGSYEIREWNRVLPSTAP